MKLKKSRAGSFSLVMRTMLILLLSLSPWLFVGHFSTSPELLLGAVGSSPCDLFREPWSLIPTDSAHRLTCVLIYLMAEVRSDRKTTISYAIDLLRAHQLRRENAFLHEEVQACRKEIVAMHEELKQMRSTVHDCHAVSARASSLSDEYQIKIDKQAVELDLLRDSYQTAKVELADLKIACDKNHNSAQVELELFKKEGDLVRLNYRRIEDTQKSQYDDLKASVAELQVLVNEKHDLLLVESLRKRVEELTLPDAVPGFVAGSASRVPDSFERKAPCFHYLGMHLWSNLLFRSKWNSSPRLTATRRHSSTSKSRPQPWSHPKASQRDDTQ